MIKNWLKFVVCHFNRNSVLIFKIERKKYKPVGFWPKDLITVASSVWVIVPSPSKIRKKIIFIKIKNINYFNKKKPLSNIENASLKLSICSAVKLGSFSTTDVGLGGFCISNLLFTAARFLLNSILLAVYIENIYKCFIFKECFLGLYTLV